MASSKTALDPTIPLLLRPAEAKRDVPRSYNDRCFQDKFKPEVVSCHYGVTVGATRTIALVGGSHSAHWLPAFEALAGEYGWRIVSLTKNACPFEVNNIREPSCIKWNEDVHEHLVALRPDVVFTTSTRFRYTDPDRPNEVRRREMVPGGYLKQWRRLAANGIRVIAVRDSPWMSVNVPDCIEMNYPDILKCARPRGEWLDDVDPVTQLEARPGNVDFIDLTDRFCDARWCLPVNGNVIIYRDKDHLTASYAESLAPVLAERMRAVRPDLFAAAPTAAGRLAGPFSDGLPQ